jgi:hypothetical protein
VELRGLEPLTPCMPCRCATSCATAPSCSLRNLCVFPKQPDQRSPECARMRIDGIWLPSRSHGIRKAGAGATFGQTKIRRNLSIPADHPVELRGLEPLTPCMPCRCATSCATAPYSCCFRPRALPGGTRSSVRIAPKQLKYLRTAFPKIPNRVYSVPPLTPARRLHRP